MVLIAGIGTLLIGGYRALKQHDIKLVLAFGTVSQLGLIPLMVGYGEAEMALAGLMMLCAHALFKSALFLSVGIVDVAMGTRDLRELSGVGRAMPVTATFAGLATASMIGLPPFAGFVAKEATLRKLSLVATSSQQLPGYPLPSARFSQWVMVCASGGGRSRTSPVSSRFR